MICAVTQDDHCLDHIVTMQQSLEYYDRVLGQSHPAYLSGLNLVSAKARNQLDQAASKLSLILVSRSLLVRDRYVMVSRRRLADRLFDSRYVQHECQESP